MLKFKLIDLVLHSNLQKKNYVFDKPNIDFDYKKKKKRVVINIKPIECIFYKIRIYFNVQNIIQAGTKL